MMAESRSSALSKRAEQLKRWEESDTNKQSPFPKLASRIQFSSGIVFLAACTAGDKEEVQRLLKLGADINTANVDGLTALHQACIDDNLDMVEFLVSRGADVNRGDNEGWTPLHATASCGFLSIARYLLENGADVAAVNYDGELPIDIAESDQMEDLLQRVIDEQEIDCDLSRNAEISALMTDAKNWAKNGYVEVHDPKTGATPLHVAAAKGYIDVARLLLEDCHVDPDSVDYEGWTPLHAAALWGQKEASAILLKKGADPVIKNYSGQTCMDLVEPSLVSWLQDAILTCPAKLKKNLNNNNNNNKPKRTQQPDVKRVELKIAGQGENNVNDKPPSPSEIIPKITDGKPPKGRPPSPDITAEPTDATNNEEPPSWRRSASFRTRQNENKDNKVSTQNNAVQFDNDGRVRRTHSFENDKTLNDLMKGPLVSHLISQFNQISVIAGCFNESDIFYQRYRDVTARIKASSCPSIPPLPQSPHDVIELRPQQNLERSTNNKETNEEIHFRKDRDPLSPPVTTAQTTVRSPTETADMPNNTTNSAQPAATPTKLSPGNIFKNFFKSFVPPVRDDESETQRKAHAKRVRETRRSTQGVTLDELKSAEQLVKKKSSNGTIDTSASPQKNETEENSSDHNSSARGGLGSDVAVTLALASATATATATIAASAGERRPSWRLRLDPTNKFELEDAGRSASPRPVSAPSAAADTTITIPLRRPPTALSTSNAISTPTVPVKEEKVSSEVEKERECGIENKSPPSNSTPASTQAALNVIQRRRRPKRRSTGVGHVDMDDIINDRGTEGEAETETSPSGSERTTDAEPQPGEEKDYKALYEASSAEVRRLRDLLATSEQQLRDARATIVRFSQVNQINVSEQGKREKRAMERKLSEMEEELKFHQVLQAENQRLKDENGALIRVISKLSK